MGKVDKIKDLQVNIQDYIISSTYALGSLYWTLENAEERVDGGNGWGWNQ